MEIPHVLSEFVTACRSAIESDQPRAGVVALVNELVATPDTLASTIPPMDTYDVTPAGLTLGGDVVLYEDNTVTIVLVDTLPGVMQPPHDHRMVAIIGVFQGREEQRFYARTADGTVLTTGRTPQAGDVVTIGSDGVHAISTPDPICRAIHVYLGSLSTTERSIFHPDTLEEQMYALDVYNDFCRTTD